MMKIRQFLSVVLCLTLFVSAVPLTGVAETQDPYLTGYFTPTAVTVDGKLSETWLTAGSFAGNVGRIGVLYDANNIYFGIKSATATAVNLTVNGVSLSYSIAYGFATTIEGASAAVGSGVVEIAVPFAYFGLRAEAADTKVDFAASVVTADGEAALDAEKLSLRFASLSNVRDMDNETPATKWGQEYNVGSGTTYVAFNSDSVNGLVNVAIGSNGNGKNTIHGRYFNVGYAGGAFNMEVSLTIRDLPQYTASGLSGRAGWDGIVFEVKNGRRTRWSLLADEKDNIYFGYVLSGSSSKYFDTGLQMGDFAKLRLEVAADGTSALYINDVLINTFTQGYAHSSTSANLTVIGGNYNAVSTAGTMDVDIHDLCFYSGYGNVLDQLTFDTIKGNNATQERITSNLALPATLSLQDISYPVTWSSSNTAIMGNDGKLSDAPSGDVTMTASVTVAGEVLTKSFDLTLYEVLDTNMLYLEQDLNPYVGAMNITNSPTNFTLDGTYNSVGYDLGSVQTFNRVVLTNANDTHKLKKSDLSLYVSDDNVTYTRVKDWDMARSGKEIYLYNFSAEGRYVKVHCHFDTADELSFTNKLNKMIWAGNEVDLPGNGGGSFSKLSEVNLRATSTDYDTVAFVYNDDLATAIAASKADRSDLRFLLDGKVLPYYLTAEGVYLRMPYTEADKVYTIDVYGGNEKAVDLSDMEYVYEVTYGNRTVTDLVDDGYVMNAATALMPNGDLITIGDVTTVNSGKIYLRRSTDGGRTWSAAELMYDDPNDYSTDGFSFLVDGNRIMMFAHVSEPGNRTTYMFVSDNNGYTWETPVNVGHDTLINVCNYCDGIFAPSYDGAEAPGVDYVVAMNGWIRSGEEQYAAASVIYSTDCGATWQSSKSTLTGGLEFDNSENGLSEPSVVALEDGTLLMLARAQNCPEQVFYQSYSYDNGITWTDAAPSKVYTSNTMPTLKHYDDEILLLWAGNTVQGSASYFRYPLTLATSEDGETWEKKLNAWQGTSRGHAAGYLMRATQPSIALGVGENGEDAYITWWEYNQRNTGLLIEDFDEYLNKTKGAANTFEGSSALYADWQPTYKGGNVPSATVEISSDMAATGSQSLKIVDGGRAARSMPNMLKGEMSFDINLNNITGNVTMELKSAYTGDYWNGNRLHLKFYDNGNITYLDPVASWTGLGAVMNADGWNNVKLKFDLLQDKIDLYINGTFIRTLSSETLSGTPYDTAQSDPEDGISFITLLSENSTPVYIDNFIAYEGVSMEITEPEDNYYVTEVTAVDGSVSPAIMHKWDSISIDNEARTINIVMPSYNNPRVASIVHSGGTTSLIGEGTANQNNWTALVEQYENAYLYDGQVLEIPSTTGKTTKEYTVHITYPEVELQGSGTEADPYLITSDEDFAYIYGKIQYTSWSDKTSAWGLPGAHFKQTADVSYSGALVNKDSWTNNLFFHYDGDGHTITFNCTTDTYAGALFAGRFYGTLENVTLAGTVSATGGTMLAGTVRNGAVLRNIHSTLTQGGANTFIVSSSCDSGAIVENFLHTGKLNGTGLCSAYWGYGKSVYTTADNMSANWSYHTDVRATVATGELLATLNAYAEENGLVAWGQEIGIDASPILGKVFVPKPVISLTPSIENNSSVTTGTVLTLTANEGATIRYTLDGSEPNEDSAVYADGITLVNDGDTAMSVTVKVLVTMADADDVTATYIYTVTPPPVLTDSLIVDFENAADYTLTDSGSTTSVVDGVMQYKVNSGWKLTLGFAADSDFVSGDHSAIALWYSVPADAPANNSVVIQFKESTGAGYALKHGATVYLYDEVKGELTEATVNGVEASAWYNNSLDLRPGFSGWVIIPTDSLLNKKDGPAGTVADANGQIDLNTINKIFFSNGGGGKFNEVVMSVDNITLLGDANAFIENLTMVDPNRDGVLNSRDAIHLLYHTMLPDQYAVKGNADVNADGIVSTQDAIYMLYHIMLPENYPLYVSPVNGLNISFIGDSISSYDGYSNDGTTNTTLAGRSNGGMQQYLKSVDETWWYQSAEKLGMNVLVNNSWSGSCVFGIPSNGSQPACGDRAVNLHCNVGDKNGTTPDVIAAFIGTNDFKNGAELGTYREELYNTIITDNGDGTYTYAEPTTFIEGYIIMMHKMTTTYPDAKVFCLTLHPNTWRVDDAALQEFNAAIKTIAADFSAHIVDIYASELDSTSTYLADGLHFNAIGMDVVSEVFEAAVLKAYRK
ncbi:MAG: exo-alpha-sialidase [Clostridia bacterium]|nr:exo-alpha-sialidase [Clostridia bacterium]